MYSCNPVHRLLISSESIKRFSDYIGFFNSEKEKKLRAIIEGTKLYRSKWETPVEKIEFVRRDEVWDAEVSDIHAFDANGFYAHNSEILLRPNQFCNLSEIVVRGDDTIEKIKDKARVAAILGTLQATISKFRYLRTAWKRNTEEERLLGVSLTGIMDHPILNDASNPELPGILAEIKQVVLDTNKEWADKLGISAAMATTCVKPSGTVSQLVNSASGIHARFAPFYIRRVRIDAGDPMASFMKEKGVPWEVDKMNASTMVFSFPIKSPEGAIFANEESAMDQLERWKIYQDHWCEHKPSCTVYYSDDEFLQVGAWVWKHFDSISGVSFLPKSDHVYMQAPYEEISEEKYEQLRAELPKVNWRDLEEYETEDTTTSSHTLACSGGLCEVVDLVGASE